MDVGVEDNPENVLNRENGASKIQEQMQKRNETRLKDMERRKEAKQSQSVAKEKRDYFSIPFNEERTCIEALLSSCDATDRAATTKILEEATAKTLMLQKFVNDSMQFLTPYDLRQAQAALQKLQASLTETREKALPKKKFTFRARTKEADKVPSQVADEPLDTGKTRDPSVTKVDGALASEQCGFFNVNNQILTKTAEEIQNRDVLLTHLTNCKVRLFGSPSTLHLKHIDSCEILCGPVSTSVFVDHCRNSTLAVPCQQLRTHNTTDTRVYLHVTSRAIIEDCHAVSFAPFSWSYPTLEEDFSVSGLDRERNNWSQVDDFNWLAAGTPSPNWSLIPEEDRKTTWDAELNI